MVLSRYVLGALVAVLGLLCLALYGEEIDIASLLAHMTPTRSACNQPAPALDSAPFWAFIGVSSALTRTKPTLVMSTWASRLPKETVQWYGEGEFDNSLGSVIEVTDAVYRSAVERKEGYKFMAFKLQWIWHDALTRISKDTKWLIRHFDDVYIFLNSLHSELELYDPDQPILIGHRHATVQQFPFPDGGNPWILSRGAVKLLREKNVMSGCINGTISPKKARQILGPESHEWANCRDSKKPGLWCAEDVYLWYCMHLAGVKFVHFRGESWFPQDLKSASFSPTLSKSVLGVSSQDEVSMLPKPHYRGNYCALHPVPSSTMKYLWSQEQKILKKAKSKLQLKAF